MRELLQEFLPAFRQDEFYFSGAFLFSREGGADHFLLGRNGCSILLTTPLIDDIRSKSLSDALKFKLIQRGLATTPGAKEATDQYEIKRACREDILPGYFLIDTTGNCNLNCVYCFRDLKKTGSIALDKLEDICTYILDILKKSGKKKACIQLWGGEPLLALDRIQFVHDFFVKHEIDPDLSIETNGTLLTDDNVKILKELGVNVGVSLDGLPVHQNMQRPTQSGEDSMPALERGLDALKRGYGDEFGAITVVTRKTADDIEKIIDFYSGELQIGAVKFNLVKDNSNANEKSLGPDEEQIRRFAEKLYDTVELRNTLGVPFQEINIMDRVTNLLYRKHSSSCCSNGCNGGFDLISFDGQGNIYPCDMIDFTAVCMGSIYENGSLKPGTSISEIIRQARESKAGKSYFDAIDSAGCADCPWFYFCKGGCSASMIYQGKERGIDQAECEFNKVIYPKIISSVLRRRNWFQQGDM